MNNVNPQIITPIIAILLMFGERLFHVQFSSDDMHTITDGVLSIVALIGVFTHPTKPQQ